MKIFGVDPGTARVGWSVIEGTPNNPQAIAYGCITTSQKDAPEEKLLNIYRKLLELLQKYKPDSFSVEELFFAANAKTAISVGQARGVIMLAAAQYGISVISYTPLQVKLTICGTGRAEKIQVQKMVTKILQLPEIPKPDDAADALAIALTHLYTYRLKTKYL